MSTPVVTPSPFDLEPPPKAAAAPWWSAWEDVLDVCYAPTEVFGRRRDGRYLASFLVIGLLSLLIGLLSAQVMETIADLEINKRIAERAASGSPMKPEEVAAAKAGVAMFAKFGVYLTPVLIAFGMWVGGLALWLLSMMLGGKLGFGQATTIALLASVPELIERAVVGAQGLLLDTGALTHKYSFNIGAARFLPADADKWLMTIAALADPFVIWGAAIVGIGVYVLANLEKEKAAVVAVLYTVILGLLFR
jgi:hypothetical protein